MSVREALEARIRADPRDWDSWRVFGDWLLEQGDVRGELIQRSYRLARDARTSAEERASLEAWARALERKHRERWLQGLVVPWWARLDWRHGFVVGVKLRWADETLPFLDRLGAHPVGRFLSRLDLSGVVLGADGAGQLAASAALRGLASLDLSWSPLGDTGARALAASESLRSLVVLNLQRAGIGDRGVAALAGSGNLRALTELNLRGNAIGDTGAIALARSSTLRSLTWLDLGENRIGDPGRAALAGSEGLRGCRVSAGGGA